MTIEELISDLFKECNQIRETIGVIGKSAEQIKAIAINAAVAATHTGIHVKIFTEIANQVEKSGKKIDHATREVRREIDDAINFNLKIVITQSHLNKYNRALPNILDQKNRNLISACCEKLENISVADLKKLFGHVLKCEGIAKNLLLYQGHLFSILNCIKIEANNLEGKELTIILSLAEILEGNHQSCVELLQNALLQIRNIRCQISCTLAMKERELFYELHQAV